MCPDAIDAMLIKPAENHDARLRLLDTLMQREGLDARQRNWLCAERWRVASAADAGSCLEPFVESANHAVLHGLRLAFGDDVVEIDHLLIDRTMSFFVIDSHAWWARLQVSPYGEFRGEYPGVRGFVIDSPINRCRHNAAMLGQLLEGLGIRGRMKTVPACVPLVVMAPGAGITRPDPEAFDTRCVIGGDRFAAWYADRLARFDLRGIVHGLLNACTAVQVGQWGERLLAEHRPVNPLAVPGFIEPD